MDDDTRVVSVCVCTSVCMCVRVFVCVVLEHLWWRWGMTPCCFSIHTVLFFPAGKKKDNDTRHE